MTITENKPLLRGVSHRAAFVVSLTLAPIVVVSAPGVWPRLITALYTLAIVALFGVSALYHRVNWGPTNRQRLQKFDHVTIFLAIAATYTPVAAFVLTAWAAKLVLILVWGGAVLGTVIRLRFPHCPQWMVAAPYLIVGWCLLAVIKDAWQQLGVLGFILFLSGGLLYTAGAIVFANQKPNPWPQKFGFHEIFHSLTVTAASLHYVAFVFVVLPKAR
ncbi:MAG: hemolysin III family protein [Actinomycetota bacterium]|nr:hemolysin III [Opitutae bacterium]MEC7916001.1 hemolysin III family protein [Actinomycetota bacterium]MEC9059250.1 hemolysin III family protein [Actinomycetota bacterium]MED5361949.1 hemolysin III family protein [Actinomycetota bacterium]